MTTDLDPVPISGVPRKGRILIYGDEGIGKSTLCLNIAKELNFRVLWLTADNTWSVAQTPEFEHFVDRIPWTKLGQIPAIANKLVADRYQQHYGLVMLDPVSTAFGDALGKVAKSIPLKDQYAPGVPARPHYYMIKSEAENLTHIMREVPCDVAYIAHVKDTVTPVRPSMNEEAAKALYRECNVVGYVFRKPGEPRQIQLAGTTSVKAKIQIPAIPEGIYSVDDFINRYVGWRKETNG